MTRLVRLYTAFQFFFGLLLWLPVYYAYQEAMGLSAAEIFQIQSLYQIAFCFLEIPTGYFADRKGYLSSMRLGALTLIAANLLPIFIVSYAGFLIHFCLIALSRSFISGASSAYLYEALRERGRSSSYKEIEGAARAYGLIGKVVGWAGVGAMMAWHVTLPYWLTVLASALSLVFAMMLPRLLASTSPADQGKASETTSSAVVIAALGELKQRPFLMLVMLQGVAIFVLSRVCQVTLFQPILTDKAIPLETHGLVMSAMTLFEALGSWKPQLARRYLSDLSAVTWLTVVLALAMLTLPIADAWASVAALCVFSLAVGWSFPVQKQLMNDAIRGTRGRATLLSIESIIDRGISALVTLLLATYMAENRMNDFIIDSAVATLIAIVVIGFFAAKLAKNDSPQSTAASSASSNQSRVG